MEHLHKSKALLHVKADDHGSSATNIITIRKKRIFSQRMNFRVSGGGTRQPYLYLLSCLDGSASSQFGCCFVSPFLRSYACGASVVSVLFVYLRLGFPSWRFGLRFDGGCLRSGDGYL